MDFSLSEEQLLLQDSVQKYIQNEYGFDAFYRELQNGQCCSPDRWREFADLGWLGVPIDDEYGGFGGSILDLIVMLEEFGKGYLRDHYIETVVTGAGLIAQSGNDELKSEILPAIANGECRLALAHLEKSPEFRPTRVALQAKRRGKNFVLDGSKNFVTGGDVADKIIVSARTAGQESDEDGVTLFLVDVDSSGVTRKSFPMLDGSTGATFVLEGATIGGDKALGGVGNGAALIVQAMNRANVAYAAEAVGIMQKLVDTTVEYTRTRKQFGHRLAEFQVIRHRMVDMFLRLQESRSLLLLAAIRLSREDKAVIEAAALKAKICEAGRYISHEAVQLHGGIGITDELEVGHCLKRLHVIATLFGNRDYHIDRFATLEATTFTEI